MGVLEDRKLLGISRTLSVLYIDGSKGVPAMSSKQSTDLKVREETEKFKRQSSAAEDAADKGAKRMRPGAFGKTAERALTIYREKRAQIKKLSGREFTPQPEESGADEGMAEQVAGMIATYEQLIKRTQEASDGADMRERAERKADSERLDKIRDVLICWFTANGLDLAGKRDISREEMSTAARAFPGRLKDYQEAVLDREHRVMQLLSDEVRETDSFRKSLKGALEKSEGELKGRMSRCMEYLKTAVKLDEGKGVISRELVERVGTDIKTSMKKEAEYICTRDQLLKDPEFEGLEEVIREHYRVALNLVTFIAESAEQFLEYIVDKKEPDFMHGNYIRVTWGADCNRVEPLKPIDAQIELIDERIRGYDREELRSYPVTYLIQAGLEESKKLKREDVGELTLERLKSRCEALMKRKDEYPDLFVEPGAIRIFRLIPEMIELFEEAKALRRDMSMFAESKADSLDRNELEEFKRIYALCSAFYDTLLTRHIYIVSSSRLTLPEIIDAGQSFHTAAFEYCLKEYEIGSVK